MTPRPALPGDSGQAPPASATPVPGVTRETPSAAVAAALERGVALFDSRGRPLDGVVVLESGIDPVAARPLVQVCSIPPADSFPPPPPPAPSSPHPVPAPLPRVACPRDLAALPDHTLLFPSVGCARAPGWIVRTPPQ